MVVKIIKVLGTSEESFQDATNQAVQQASETIEDIQGVEIDSQTASVEDGEIVQYKSTVEVSFPVKHEE